MTIRPKLLVSPRNVGEARNAIDGGADIIDVKNPKQGSLGASFPWMLKEIRSIVPMGLEMSAAIGDFSFMPGTASLSAYAASSLGVDYVKIGLKVDSQQKACKMAENVRKAVKSIDSDINVVLAGYADHARIGSVGPKGLIQAAHEAKCDFCMLDTFNKDKGGLFSYLTLEELSSVVEETHDRKMKFAVGGSLSIDDIPALLDARVDVIGVRGAVCAGSRMNAISQKKVADFSKEIDEFF